MDVSFDPASLGELYPFTPQRLQLSPQVSMSYLDEGPRDADDVLLMLHGNPTWSFYYRGLLKAFSSETRCVVPDHVGCGLSDKPQNYPYTLATHIANIDRLVSEELDLRNVTLVVHDWGGSIGMGWALRNRDRLKRIVVLNTSAFRSKHIPLSINICRIPLFGALTIRGFNAFARAATIRAAKNRLPRDVARAYLAPYDSWKNRIGNLRFVQDIPMHPRVPSWPVLAEIEAGLPTLSELPMLICWGGADFCFHDLFLEGWRERFPDAEIHRFPQAGHYVLEDAGPQVVEIMRAFFARSSAPLPAQP